MTTHLRTIIFVLGVVFGIIVGEKSPYATELAVASSGLFSVQIIIYYISRRRGTGSYIALTLSLLSLGLLFGVVRTQFLEEPRIITCEKSCKVEGVVVAKGEARDSYQMFDVEVEPDTDYVRVRAPLFPEYTLGDKMTLRGVTREPENISPHKGSKSFDYVSYLHLHNVGSEMYYPKMELLETEGEKSSYFRLRLFQEKLVDSINQYVARPAAYLASGMLLGVTNFSQEMTDMFRVAGLSHIVVLSGFNITVLIIFVLFLLRPLPVLVRVALALTLVVVFVVMVGGGASLVRASLMAGISLIALVLGRGYVAQQALMLSFLTIIFYSPLSLLHDVSLHLSFLATCGILYGYEYLHTYFSKPFSKGVSAVLSSTLAAYVATLPYILFTFGSLSVYAVLSSLLVLPFVPVTMSFTAITLMMSFINDHLAIIFGVISTFLANTIIWVAQMITGLPFAQVKVHISFFIMLCVYVVLISVVVFFRTREEDETIETKDGDLLSSVLRF